MRIALFKAALAATVALASSQVAAAEYVFDFTNSGHTASGSLTTATAAPSLVTGITGTADGQAITGLSSFASADNQLFATTPFFDFSGLSFLANGVAYNVYGSGGLGYLFTSTEYPSGSAPDTAADLLSTNRVTLRSSVPEPATWAMMLMGFGAIGAAVRRRTRTASIKGSLLPA